MSARSAATTSSPPPASRTRCTASGTFIRPRRRVQAHPCKGVCAGKRRIACAAALVGHRLRPRRIARKKAYLHTTQLHGAWHVPRTRKTIKRSQRRSDRFHIRGVVKNAGQCELHCTVLDSRNNACAIQHKRVQGIPSSRDHRRAVRVASQRLHHKEQRVGGCCRGSSVFERASQQRRTTSSEPGRAASSLVIASASCCAAASSTRASAAATSSDGADISLCTVYRVTAALVEHSATRGESARMRRATAWPGMTRREHAGRAPSELETGAWLRVNAGAQRAR